LLRGAKICHVVGRG